MVDKVLLGFICKTYRIKKGKTQAEIAKALNINQSIISRFENGKNCNISVLLYYILEVIPMGSIGNLMGVVEWQ